MNLILLQPDEVHDGEVWLTDRDRRAEHLRKVLKVEQGDTVRVGILGGLMGRGIVAAVDKREVRLAITIETQPPAKLGLSLVLALPRPIMVKRVLAQAAALGVDHLFLVNAKRVEKSFFEASPVKDSDFAPYLHNGLEQGVDTMPPTVSVHPRFKPFVEDTLPSLATGPKLIAHPEGATTLDDCLTTSVPSSPILVAIGPEGGWIDYEVDTFREAGFLPFSLGPRILRVDTAVPAIIAQIDLLRHLRAASSRRPTTSP